MRTKFYTVCFVACLFLSLKAFSQNGIYGNNTLTERPNTPIDSMINGYIEVVPNDYASNPSKHYPLIIFLEGQNQFGNGSPTELKNLYSDLPATVPMFPDIVVANNDFPNSYNVGGTTYEFIVLIPQARYQVKHNRPSAEQMLSPSEVNDIISYSLQNYRVDVNRIYLMGLSLGGGSTWNYAGQSVSYANRLAAIVPFAGASDLNDNHSRVTNIAQANLPVWTFVASGDQPYATLGQNYIDSILTHPEHTTEALITTYSGGHDETWIEPLVNNNTGQPSHPNLYEWLLGYALGLNGRTALSQPIFANIDAGSSQTINLSNGSMVLGTNSISFTGATANLSGTASAGAGGNAIVSTQWAKVDGNGGTITNPNSLNTTVTNLKPGSYTFQLRATDNQGLVSVDTVKINVIAPLDNEYTRVTADAYSSVSGTGGPLVDKTFVDEGPIYGLGFWDAGRSASYTLNNVAPGNYALYYRYNSLFGNPSIQISSGGVTVTRTLATTSGDVWRSDSIHLDLGANPTIQFLSQSSASSTTWNFDYFELALLTAGSPLPVKFVYFNAQCKDNAVNLSWKTAQEQNISGFSVQRSSDGINWVEIGKVGAAGQNPQEKTYVFIDRTPSANNMYRIVERDITGQQTISSIVRNSCSLERNAISVYPNPTSGNSALSMNLDQASTITLQLVDSKGGIIQQRQIQLPRGSTTVPIDMNDYPKGLYSIIVRYGNETKTIKVIKQ